MLLWLRVNLNPQWLNVGHLRILLWRKKAVYWLPYWWSFSLILFSSLLFKWKGILFPIPSHSPHPIKWKGRRRFTTSRTLYLYYMIWLLFDRNKSLRIWMVPIGLAQQYYWYCDSWTKNCKMALWDSLASWSQPNSLYFFYHTMPHPCN